MKLIVLMMVLLTSIGKAVQPESHVDLDISAQITKLGIGTRMIVPAQNGLFYEGVYAGMEDGVHMFNDFKTVSPIGAEGPPKVVEVAESDWTSGAAVNVGIATGASALGVLLADPNGEVKDSQEELNKAEEALKRAYGDLDRARTIVPEDLAALSGNLAEAQMHGLGNFGATTINLGDSGPATVGLDPYLSPNEDWALNQIDRLREVLLSVDPSNTTQQNAQQIGLESVDASFESLEANNHSDANSFYQIGVAMADIALGFVPGVGAGRDLYEFISGESLLTGEELSGTERAFAALGAITGGLGSRLKTPFKYFKKLVDDSLGSRIIKSLDDLEIWDSVKANRYLEKPIMRNNPGGTYHPPVAEGSINYVFKNPTKTKVGEWGRVYTSTKRSLGKKEGHFLLPLEAIKDLEPIAIKKKFDLENIPNKVVDVIVEKDVKLMVSLISESKSGLGKRMDTVQVYVMDGLDKVQFLKEKSL